MSWQYTEMCKFIKYLANSCNWITLPKVEEIEEHLQNSSLKQLYKVTTKSQKKLFL